MTFVLIYCAGSGSYARMKIHMTSHVDDVRHSMFKASCDHVRNKLKEALRDVEKSMDNKADEVFYSMRRDYRSALGGGDVPKGELMPKWQREMRKSVMDLIGDAEKIFKKAAGIEVGDMGDVSAMDTSVEGYTRNVKKENDLSERNGDNNTFSSSAVNTEALEDRSLLDSIEQKPFVSPDGIEVDTTSPTVPAASTKAPIYHESLAANLQHASTPPMGISEANTTEQDPMDTTIEQ